MSRERKLIIGVLGCGYGNNARVSHGFKWTRTPEVASSSLVMFMFGGKRGGREWVVNTGALANKLFVFVMRVFLMILKALGWI